MYKLNLQAPWDEVKEKIKEIDSTLTDDDLHYEPGQERILLERLAKLMDKDVMHVKNWIESVSFNKGKAS